MTTRIREWVKAHPSEFGISDAVTVHSEEEGGLHADGVGAGGVSDNGEKKTVDGAAVESDSRKEGFFAHAGQITGNPIMLGIIGLVVLLVAFNIYQLLPTSKPSVVGRSRPQQAVRA